jgi:hypothetical protein
MTAFVLVAPWQRGDDRPIAHRAPAEEARSQPELSGGRHCGGQISGGRATLIGKLLGQYGAVRGILDVGHLRNLRLGQGVFSPSAFQVELHHGVLRPATALCTSGWPP